MDKTQFLQPAAAQEQLELARGTVTIRGLSRSEAIEVSGLAGDLPAQERLALRYGLVEPALTADEVDAYYGQPGNIDEIQQLVQAIQRLSLSGKEGAKSDVLGVRGAA